MNLPENGLTAELLGVFKIERHKYINKKAHARSYDTISIRLAGRGDFKTEKGELSVTRGDVLYLPAGADYQQASEDETLLVIHFINHNRKKDADAHVLRPKNYLYVEELITKMYDEWKGLKVGYHYKCTALFYELLYCLHTVKYGSPACADDEKKIKKALDIIHANYRKADIEISALAKACAVSESYFRKLFKRTLGKSALRYVTTLRLDFAKGLLQSGLYTVSEAARRAGFSDTKYFSRLFKSYFRTTPKQYRLNYNSLSVM